jgi:hypothetical protein
MWNTLHGLKTLIIATGTQRKDGEIEADGDHLDTTHSATWGFDCEYESRRGIL